MDILKDLKEFHKDEMEFPISQLLVVLQELNQVIADSNYEIGVSYFLRHDLKDSLPDVWQTELEPYLEEYFFDQPETVDKFRWTEIQNRLGI